MRQIRTSGSTSGEWKRSTVGYSGTGNRKGRPTRMANLPHRATPRLYYSGLAFAPAFGGDLDLVADLRGLLARDVPLAFGFAMLSVIIRSFSCSRDVSQVALGVHPRTAHSGRHPVP